jgi:prevent-host-death family protein
VRAYRAQYVLMASGETTVTDTRPLLAPAADIAREFKHYSDLSLTRPVVVTENGRARNVILSIEEYDRLKSRDQLAFRAEETPEPFLAEIEKLASEDAA